MKFAVDGEMLGLSQLLTTDFSEFYVISKLAKAEKIRIKLLEYYIKFIATSALANTDLEQLFISALQLGIKFITNTENYKTSQEIISLFLSDGFEVSLFYIKMSGGLSQQRNKLCSQKHQELLSNIDYGFVNLIMNPDTWLNSNVLTKIGISLVKNISYESFHRPVLENLLKLCEDIYMLKDKASPAEFDVLLSIGSNISVYMNVLFSLGSTAVCEFINSSASKLSMHLCLVIPVIPLIQDPPNSFIGEIKIICSKLIRLLEKLIKTQNAESLTNQHMGWCKEAFCILTAITENYSDCLFSEKANVEKILESLSVMLISKYTNSEVQDYDLIESVFKLSLRLGGGRILPSISPKLNSPNATFKKFYIIQRVMKLAIAKEQVRELALCYSSLIPLVVFSNNMELNPKFAQSYTKELAAVFIDGFQSIRSPYLFSLFLKIFLEFAKVFPHGIKVSSKDGSNPLANVSRGRSYFYRLNLTLGYQTDKSARILLDLQYLKKELEVLQTLLLQMMCK